MATDSIGYRAPNAAEIRALPTVRLVEDIANILQHELQLQEEAELTGEEFIGLWEVQNPTVVVGRSGNIEADVRTVDCAANGVPVLRRHSGGGTVLLASGCLNYTLILNLERRPQLCDVRGSYETILQSIVRAAYRPGVLHVGSDLTTGGRKFGGCSQKRSRRTLLHHGTILYDFDISLVSRYLREPAKQPDYRQRRSHAGFLTNVPLDSGFAARFVSAYPSARVIV